MRTFRHHLPVYGLYLLLALVVTWPAVTQVGTHFMGGGTSDAYEVARHGWWFTHALRTAGDIFYQSNLGYPDGFSSAVFLSVPLYAFPMAAFAFILPLSAAYNLTIWLNMALNGWAAYALMRHLLDETAGEKAVGAALLAGAAYMAFPVMQAHLADGHIGLMVAWGAPLYALALLHLIDGDRLAWGWLAATVAAFWLTPAGHILQAIYVLAPLTGGFGLWCLWRRDWRGLRRLLLAALIAGGLYLVYLLPVIAEILGESAYADTGGYVRFSADLLAPVTPSFLHPLYGNLDYPRRVLGINIVEGMAYVGVVGGLLALVGALSRRAARGWLLLALVAWALALGPIVKVLDTPVMVSVGEYDSYLTLPWAGLYTLPGMNLARTPGRFNYTLALAVAVMIGYGATVLGSRLTNARLRRGALIAVGALLLVDYQTFWPVPTVPAAIPQAVADLRQRDDVRAIFNVPHDHLLAAKDALYLQTAHEKPLIAGQVTRQTPVNPAKLDILATLDPAHLQQTGADRVIFHHARAAEIGQYETLQAAFDALFAAPIYRDERIALYETPATDESPALTLLAEPDSVPAAYDMALYTPEAAWVDLSAEIAADDRSVVLLRDNIPLHRWQIEGDTSLSFSVPLPDTGYYRLTLALDPPCPVHFDAQTLACRQLAVTGAVIAGDYGMAQAVDVGGGITLMGYSAPDEMQTGPDTLTVRLWWAFDQVRDMGDVRFVHVFDMDGEIVAQSDTPLGAFAPGDYYAESVSLSIADLPPGIYAVRAGWYDFDTLTNYGDPAILGQFTLP